MLPSLPKFPRGDAAWALAAATIAFIAYLTTVGPSIGFIDAGELAAVAHTFGVAHPTGYPLFTLVAGAFSHLPLDFLLGESVIRRLNLFAALCCAASVFLFFKVFLALLRRASGGGQGRGLADRASGGLEFRNRLAAATGALALAFSRTFWSQATAVEVYSLHLLMVALILLLFARALPQDAFAPTAPAPAKKTAKPRAEAPADRKRLFLFAFVLGLGFTNHMTTLLLLPGLAWTYFSASGLKRREAWADAGRALPFFLAGLSLYLYLPLRAAAWPALNWGAIVDFESFFWHVSGKQYSGWMFSSLEPAGRNLALFLTTWPSDFGYAALVPALAGWGWLFARARRLFHFSLLLFLGCLAYAINYDISDVANYFLLAHVATALAAAFGARLLLEKAPRGAARISALVACAACVALPLALNHRAVDESGNHAVEDYARELLGAAEPGAVILTYEWDAFVAGAWYLQTVEKFRPDVLVVDRELLRRAWYLRKLRHDHPEFTEGSAREIEAFLTELRAFDLGLPYAPARIQGAFEEMIAALLARAVATRPVYVTPDIEPEYLRGFGRLPAGALMRLHPPEATPRFFPREFSFRPFPKDNVYVRHIRGRYALGYVNQALFFASLDELQYCEYFLRKALEVDPAQVQARQLLARVEALKAAGSAAPAAPNAPPGP